MTARFPGVRIPRPLVALFEKRAGYLDVEDCVRAAADQAVQRRAALRIGENVRGWKADRTSASVETDRGTYRAASLIITAGAWAGTLLADLGIRFQVIRKSLYWYAAPERLYSPIHGFPGFLIETDDGSFYGFPRIDEHGLKAAEHTGGLPVADPLTVDRHPDPNETIRVERFLAEYLPAVSREPLDFATCLYTLSPDSHFVVDRHPAHPQVSFAAGLSGHGFKFATVLGEALPTWPRTAKRGCRSVFSPAAARRVWQHRQREPSHPAGTRVPLTTPDRRIEIACPPNSPWIGAGFLCLPTCLFDCFFGTGAAEYSSHIPLLPLLAAGCSDGSD